MCELDLDTLVADVLMPPIGLLLGNVDFANLFIVLKEGLTAGPYASMVDAQAAGAVTLNYGTFINTIVSFLIVAFAVFMLIKKINRLKKEEEVAPAAAPTTKECPHSFTTVHIKAVRCPNCTSSLQTA